MSRHWMTTRRIRMITRKVETLCLSLAIAMAFSS